ncbi:uncharacterized protein G2W53_010541 [Senna tora]|uniref:Uncharacterized protein n=1 Tax=Senna tora TaxID=362788 RepID=A0A835CE69_9FABA|nr:uncharacterized protein G2W53_010541 [Senna tora]
MSSSARLLVASLEGSTPGGWPDP